MLHVRYLFIGSLLPTIEAKQCSAVESRTKPNLYARHTLYLKYFALLYRAVRQQFISIYAASNPTRPRHAQKSRSVPDAGLCLVALGIRDYSIFDGRHKQPMSICIEQLELIGSQVQKRYRESS